MTQKALADGLDVAQGSISYYENGQQIPPDTANKLIELAATRGLSISFDHIYGAKPLPVARRRRSELTPKEAA